MPSEYQERIEENITGSETIEFESSVRGGGGVIVTDEKILLIDGSITSVPLSSIRDVKLYSFDMLVMGMNLVLLGIGVHLALGGEVLGGLFISAGVVSTYLLLRKRGRVIVRRADEESVVFYPKHEDDFQNVIEVLLEDDDDIEE